MGRMLRNWADRAGARRMLGLDNDQPRESSDDGSSRRDPLLRSRDDEETSGSDANGEVRERPPLLRLVDERNILEQTGGCNSAETLGTWVDSRLEAMPLGLTDMLPSSEGSAVESPSLPSLSYNRLKQFLAATDIFSTLGLGRGARVAVCVQNGAHLAAALLACMNQGCCCPLDPNSPEAELARDFKILRAEAVLVDSPTGAGALAAKDQGLACALLIPDPFVAGLFTVRLLARGSPLTPRTPHSDTALVLSTSGTTGRKKTVPYTLRTLFCGAACIIKSWDLKPEDCCLNMMPLIHIGGIARNLLGTLLSGGRLVCYPFFDPAAFWTGLEEREITWYYGSPAMHRSIMEEGKQRPDRSLHLRMVCNAAGGLPPALCAELHDRFRCSVLPSYGMSECMPISSPPPDFFERAPTTSGIPCGPEIAIIDESGAQLKPGEVGNIAVRGPPLMAGYESQEANEGAWIDGWFITGDLGYLSQGGWLYVTGRTKEVIKRGGETISPVEIEEVVRTHKDVIDVAAFGIKDRALGENIALALVLRPGPRIGLPRLRAYLKQTLRPALLPQALVYCHELPKTSTGKIRRAWLTAACKAITISQDSPWRDRILHAELSGAPLQSAEDIRIHPKKFDGGLADKALQPAFAQTKMVALQDGKMHVTYSVGEASMPKILELLSDLDDFDKPDAVVPISELRDDEALPTPKPMDFLYQLDYEPPRTKEELAIAEVWGSALGCDAGILSATADFFEVGGTSLLVGRVAAELRKRFGTSLPTHVVFSNPRLRDLASAIADCQTPSTTASKGDSDGASNAEEEQASPRLSSTAPHVLLLQLVPLALLPSVQGMLKYTSFLYCYNALCTAWLQDWNLSPTTNWYLALAVMPFIARVLFPVVGILAKWLLLGCVKPGRYPIWGQMYIRWWLAQQVMHFCGRGVFNWSHRTRRWHLRLLGASVGGSASAVFSSSHFVEGDLLTIEDGALLDSPTIKCAALDGGFLLLAPIVIERHASVCASTVLAPGAIVPAGASVGPWSSSHELQDCDDGLQRFNRLTHPEPHWLLQFMLGYPLLTFCRLLKVLPWLLMLQLVVTGPKWTSSEPDWFYQAVLSLTEPHRIGLWMLAAAVREIASPLIYIVVAIAMKWLVVGRFVPGLKKNTEWEKFRYWFMENLLTLDDVAAFAKIVGAHYAPMTYFYRLMGATVGERVFWPGTPLDIKQYDLLEIGDDVTFGSRTKIYCCDRQEARKVRISSGAMVADNCCLLPGTTLGENGLLGSGSVGNGDYPANTVSLGNIEGSAVQLMTGVPPEDDVRPYGRAMYEGKANYLVMGWRTILLINVVTRFLWAPFRSARGWSAMLVLRMVNDYICREPMTLPDALPSVALVYVTLHCTLMLIAVLLDITTKWLLIGRRRPGLYAWDTSSYCQRWKLYTSLHQCLHSGDNTLHFLGGSWWLVLYYRMLGADIGRDVCLYPWGASPSMTEPDLVTIGDRVGVENASLVAHTNSMGKYQLFTLRVGNDCTLRERSRLMAGAEMSPNSTLLEHSLVMSGDVVPPGTAWQGWPNRWQGRARATPGSSLSGSRSRGSDLADIV